MKKITNVYILLDCSEYMQGRPIVKAQQVLIKYIRALAFSKNKVKVRIIGYNDTSFNLNPLNQIFTSGKPNIGEALKQLYYSLAREETISTKRTRSIFMLHTSGTVIANNNHPLKLLFNIKEFAMGLRYIVVYGKTDSLSKRALSAFVDTEDKILPYFSDSRLCSLVDSLSR